MLIGDNYVHAILLLCAMIAMTIGSQTSVWAASFKTVASFDGTDGSDPTGLVQATNGYLYGTTLFDGAHFGGTVFKLNPLTGRLTTLYNFCSASGCADGASPGAALIQATDGNLYGTTFGGGVNNAGTIFQITPTGALTTLYSFCPLHACPNGGVPDAPLVQATIGRFYGTRFYGTTEQGGPSGDGTVFILTSNGTFKTIHSFDGTDGIFPQGLVQATNGNFYGTTNEGGPGLSGTVFEITANGTLTTLYNFCPGNDCTDGGDPMGGLVQATNGNLYGTTILGGANFSGTVFEITPNGVLTTLHNFCSEANCADGELPDAGLVQATNGNFYGTTGEDGANGFGTVFKITPNGVLTTLYNFCSEANCADGLEPNATLIQASNGKLYGTTAEGGAYNDGNVFEITP
jgi:uncharacterized repeat protein (TIGR03803 family)